MSLINILKAPIKLFRKEVITFVIIRRYDKRSTQDKLRYIAVKPNASISVLRQKVWHLLDLPDFCEEIIILRNSNDTSLPLTELRKGNDPQRPYILEVWAPANRMQLGTTIPKMLRIENVENSQSVLQCDTVYEAKYEECPTENAWHSKQSQNTANEDLNKTHNIISVNNLTSDLKRSDLMCRISSSSIFRLNGNKSRDNFANILMKIQSDLSTLSIKLSNLETRIT